MLRHIKISSPQALNNTAVEQLLVQVSAYLPELRVDMSARGVADQSVETGYRSSVS